MRTACLYNFDPLQPHFYTVKPGITGVYIIFCSKHRLWDSLEPPRLGEAVLTSIHNLCCEHKNEKYPSRKHAYLNTHVLKILPGKK